MTNKQELKKKLAEWTGFKYQKPDVIRKILTSKGVTPVIKQEGWVKPNGTMGIKPDDLFGLPNFPESLDACFKWLVPEAFRILVKQGYAVPFIALCRLWYDELVSLAGNSSNIQQAALALCLAIEKLIDSEKRVM